jgi:hypothetical protein
MSVANPDSWTGADHEHLQFQGARMQVDDWIKD